MTEQELLAKEEEAKKRHFLDILENAEQLGDWVYTYLGIRLPSDTIDPDSNSNPVDAMWQIYEAVKLNKGEDVPGYIMLSAREAYKTLSSSILEVLILSHFQLSIAHMAAIASQSNKAISYIQSFLVKLKPYYDHHGWAKVGDSKSKIQFQTPQGNSPYITVIICTLQGANSEHVPIMFLDEVDVVRDPQAYDEAKMIPGMERGTFPITVKLSTRKFAFGMMQKELELANTTGEMIKKWNILDVTERCPVERHEPNADGSKVEIYVNKKLPLRSSFEEDYQLLPDPQKPEWEKIAIHPGCVKCPLVAVCKGRLAEKPVTAKATKSSLYKPIKSVINNFKKIPPDMAEAQLMCWRPSTKGLIYPRFEATENKGNIVSIAKAWELVTGDKAPDNVNITQFVSMLHEIGAKLYAGVDWGYTHESTIVVMAVTASGYSFIVDSYGSPGLEIHDFVEIAATYQEKYNIGRWFCDNAAPANIKTLKKRLKQVATHVVIPDFKKDVLGGIEAIRSQIVTSTGSRRLLVLATPENEKIIQGFKVHHFKLDMAGNPTTTPDDEEYADIMDALRYIGQNVFSTGSSKPMAGQNVEPTKALHQAAAANPAIAQVAQGVNSELMKQEVSKRVQQPTSQIDDRIKNRKLFWNTE